METMRENWGTIPPSPSFRSTLSRMILGRIWRWCATCEWVSVLRNIQSMLSSVIEFKVGPREKLAVILSCLTSVRQNFIKQHSETFLNKLNWAHSIVLSFSTFCFSTEKTKSIWPCPFSGIKTLQFFTSASDCNLLPHLQVWGVKVRNEEYVEKH